MKKSEILKGAKKMLHSGGYVCVSVCNYTQDNLGKYWHPSALGIRNWIRKLLEGSSTLEDWLKIHHPSWQGDMWELRLRWIDWMIAHWEEKGE